MKGHDGTRLLRGVEVIRMVRLPFRRCVCWLVLLIGTLYLAGLRRIFPAIAVRQAIYRLASQPGVPEAFQNSDTRYLESFGVLVAFLGLTFLAGVGLVSLFAIASTIPEAILEPIWRPFQPSEGTLRWARLAVKIGVVLASAGVAYVYSPVWLPHALHVVGLAARAYLTMTA